MNNHCGWIALAGELPQRPSLQGIHKADWLIIGGGITGLSAAHALARRFPSQRIVLLERQRVAELAGEDLFPEADPVLRPGEADSDHDLVAAAPHGSVEQIVDP